MSLGKHLQLQQQAIEQLVQLLEQERLALAQAKVEGERLQELTASRRRCSSWSSWKRSAAVRN